MMERYVREGGEATNAILTDEMIAEANAIVDEKMAKYAIEDRERVCDIWGKYYERHFAISCRTTRDYQVYKFYINEDNTIKYNGMEGNWRE